MSSIEKRSVLPKFSVRELLLVTTIIALVMPYVYRSVFAAHRIRWSEETIEPLVASFEPKAKVIGGERERSGNSGVTEISFVVPKSSAESFTLNLKDAMEKHLLSSGWSLFSSGSRSTNGKTMGFHLAYSNGASEGVVRCQIVDRRRNKDQKVGDVEHIEMLLVWLQVP
jgi:hypothetical protein